MADPFLLAHQVAESVFDIGGKLYPVSIRDQMVRGQSIIDRAVAEGFAATGRELLVIGAGAAGAVAAMRAADWNIRTHIIDADANPFGRQRFCRTRWIDPHEYEWPGNHWWNQFYPYDAPPPHPYYGFPVPLPWPAQWADALALGWSTRFTTAYRTIPHLTFYPVTTLAPPPAAAPVFNAGAKTWAVNLSNGSPLTVGMILNAVGFGVERCEVPTAVLGGPPPMYRGIAFWDTDRFRRPNCGLKHPKVAQIVISGGGDGALQDFLRIMTRRSSVRRLYLAIARGLPGGTPAERRRRRYLLTLVEGRIAGAENRGSRSYLTGTSDVHDHDVHRLLHSAHIEAAQWALAQGAIRTVLARILPEEPADVQLIHPCIHFTQAYAFNRFLVLLIDGYYATRDRCSSRLLPGAQVTSVAGFAGHVCAPANPRGCLGQPHTVGLGPAVHPNCAAVGSPPAPPSSLKANIVIIRHGVTGIGPVPGPWNTLGVIAHPRHLLPLHCSR